MKLLADSGSTKTEWGLTDTASGTRCRWMTPGINPFYQSEAEIEELLTVHVLPYIQGKTVTTVRFYGAGCIGDKAALLQRLLQRMVCPGGDVRVETDMLGAAHALCGHEAGIACILGTGSNSCFYDGEQIVANVSPLGFILGDEGSGAVLGKLLAGNVLKHQWPGPLTDAFFQYVAMTPAEIMECVYRRPFPNRFLAGLTPFLKQHIGEEVVHELVTGSFRDFLTRNVMQYDYRHYEAHFAGSIALHFRQQLEEAAEAVGVRIGKVIGRPMEGLMEEEYRLSGGR